MNQQMHILCITELYCGIIVREFVPDTYVPPDDIPVGIKT